MTTEQKINKTRTMQDMIQQFFDTRTPAIAISNLDPYVNLVEGGLIDSIGLVDLLLFIEQETGHPIDFASLDPDRMMTLAGIAGLFGQELS